MRRYTYGLTRLSYVLALGLVPLRIRPSAFTDPV